VCTCWENFIRIGITVLYLKSCRCQFRPSTRQLTPPTLQIQYWYSLIESDLRFVWPTTFVTHFINMHKYIDPSWPRTNGSLIYIWPWRGLPITNLYNKVRSDLSQVNRFLVSDTQINSTYMYNLDRHDVAEIIVYLSTLSNT
jgi:hypothetical protein